MFEVQVKITDVKGLKTSTKFDEETRELVTTLQAQVKAHPVVLARILNLQKQRAPLYVILGTSQAVMDLEFKEPEKPKRAEKPKKQVEASKEAPTAEAEESAAAEKPAVEEKEPVPVA